MADNIVTDLDMILIPKNFDVNVFNETKSFVKKPIKIRALKMDAPFAVETKEGTMTGKAGDFLIRGIEGELYPCDKNIFEKTYEEVKE